MFHLTGYCHFVVKNFFPNKKKVLFEETFVDRKGIKIKSEIGKMKGNVLIA